MYGKAVETVEKRRSGRRDPVVIFIFVYTVLAIVASIVTGVLTFCWIGMLVYAIATLELLVMLVVFDIMKGGSSGL